MEENKIKFNPKKNEKSKDEIDIINAIEEAKRQWYIAVEYFETVNEPKLVDYAIYMEEAAKIRYMYLLSEAKKQGIKLENNYIPTEADGA